MASDPLTTRPEQSDGERAPLTGPAFSPWEIVQLARHPQRPKAPDFIWRLVRDFTELHGD